MASAPGDHGDERTSTAPAGAPGESQAGDLARRCPTARHQVGEPVCPSRCDPASKLGLDRQRRDVLTDQHQLGPLSGIGGQLYDIRRAQPRVGRRHVRQDEAVALVVTRTARERSTLVKLLCRLNQPTSVGFLGKGAQPRPESRERVSLIGK